MNQINHRQRHKVFFELIAYAKLVYSCLVEKNLNILLNIIPISGILLVNHFELERFL